MPAIGATFDSIRARYVCVDEMPQTRAQILTFRQSGPTAASETAPRYRHGSGSMQHGWTSGVACSPARPFFVSQVVQYCSPTQTEAVRGSECFELIRLHPLEGDPFVSSNEALALFTNAPGA